VDVDKELGIIVKKNKKELPISGIPDAWLICD
jgi:hypothetical protein